MTTQTATQEPQTQARRTIVADTHFLRLDSDMPPKVNDIINNRTERRDELIIEAPEGTNEVKTLYDYGISDFNRFTVRQSYTVSTFEGRCFLFPHGAVRTSKLGNPTSYNHDMEFLRRSGLFEDKK